MLVKMYYKAFRWDYYKNDHSKNIFFSIMMKYNQNITCKIEKNNENILKIPIANSINLIFIK